ncbi:hypothetical protein D9753_34855 [Streptomyces dangxiongensis]|uniref:Uncharacterized protein n=1 Tax=Streptomyces dangxiongensis TaxID=1442032 RepID=A0A3G2JNS6_9ACTN|nr:hypothetical protein [Streptomyces dangxiongensis]AYN43211.1 hypothetical protein D9753_34855 [Streptomyces dangxiongensis]
MALGVRLRRDAEAPDLDTRRVGHALLIHPRGELSAQAVAFAEGLPDDPEHRVVVLDLPTDPGDAAWTVVARLLGRGHPGGYRLVPGRTLPGGTVPVGQWLADRLDRAVVVADGAVVPAAGGVLYIPADRGPGWVRLLPRRPPTPVSRRFPKPAWEFTLSDRAWRTSDQAVVDPLPSGVWLHGDGHDGALSPHRGLLVSRLAYRPDLLTVVLGCPGGDALSLDDVSRFWHSLLPGVRDLVRFVAYGPLAVPDGPGPGQALADRLDVPVTFDNGLPVSHTPGDIPEVHALDADGSPGWAAFARQLRFTPARLTGGRPTEPAVVGHRPAFGDLPEIAPGRYRYDEAVLEVVPSGLWLRPSEEPEEAAVIRSAAPSARHVNVVFGSAAHGGGRMRELAERLLQRFDPALRALARLVPAVELVRQAAPHEPTARRAVEAGPGAGTEGAADGYGALTPAAAAGTAPPAATATGPEAPGPRVRLATAAPDFGTATAGTTSAQAAPAGVAPNGTTAAAAGPAATGEWAPAPPAGAAGPAPGAPAHAADTTAPRLPDPSAPERLAPTTAAPTGPDLPLPPRPEEPAGQAPGGVSPPGQPARSLPSRPPLPSLRLVSAPGLPSAPADDGAPDAPVPGRPDEGAAAHPPMASAPPADGPARAEAVPPAPPAGTGEAPARAPDTASAAPGARVQAVPSPAACAVPPRKDIAREREWMRNAFRQQYNDGAGAVARLLSESPGLRGTVQTSTEDVLTDLVAARLYLRGDSALLDRQVRGATVGPHVPLARCVAAGLRRLPSYRGATVLRAALGGAEWDWYRRRTLVTEWAFCWALTAAAPELPGDADVLIWSMTARRTALLDPDQPARVLFLPGTTFKVLAVRDGDRRSVLLRELSASEISADGRVDTARTALDDMALSGLQQADRTWQAAEPGAAPNLSPEQAARFTAPPGLILPAPPNPTETPAPPGKRTTP